MSHPRKTFTGAGLLLLAMFCTGEAAQEPKVTLRFKFKQGETLRYAVTVDLTIKGSATGKDVDGGGLVKFTYSLHTLSVRPDGKARLALKFERMQMSMEVAGEKVAFDTDDETTLPDQGAVDAFKAVREQGILLTLDGEGRSTDVKFPEAWEKKLKDSNGPFDLFNLPGKGGSVLPAELVLPTEAVVKGQGWRSEGIEIPTAVGKLKRDNAFSYEGSVTRGGRKLEKIGARSKITFRADPNAEVKGSVKAPEGPGTLYFDNRAGRLIEAQQSQEMEMAFEANCETVKMKMQMQMKLKLLGTGK